MRKAKHSERAQTQRTDVEWIDGVPYCQTCNTCVSIDDVCGRDCAQAELARVLKYIALKKELALRVAVTELEELAEELTAGAHR
jgi:hypothetical protein